MIRVGIGGWSFEGWRNGVFFPKGLAKARELQYASEKLNSIEINSTFHRNQSPASFRKWAAETPENFVFSVKASRFVTNRRVLADAGPAIDGFLASGITELGKKLGPILWQFPPTKKFDEKDFGAFLALLPATFAGTPLRHAIETRHESFAVPAFAKLAAAHDVAIVIAHADKHPLIGVASSGFVYIRLESSRSEIPTGYPPAEIKTWAARAKRWEEGEWPKDIPLLMASRSRGARDVFVYVISGAKERAPAAATALLSAVESGLRNTTSKSA